MLGSVSAHIPWNSISNLELRRSYKALHNDLALLSASTIRKICPREYALTVDAIKKQLPSPNEISLASDRGTSPNKLAIMTVVAYNMDQNCALHEVQHACIQVVHLFFSRFDN
jgi:hypothetical protein